MNQGFSCTVTCNGVFCSLCCIGTFTGILPPPLLSATTKSASVSRSSSCSEQLWASVGIRNQTAIQGPILVHHSSSGLSTRQVGGFFSAIGLSHFAYSGGTGNKNCRAKTTHRSLIGHFKDTACHIPLVSSLLNVIASPQRGSNLIHKWTVYPSV